MKCLLALFVFAVSTFSVLARPNIVFVLVDDMGWGDLGIFYQNSREFSANRNKPAFTTPRLDSLASEGIQLRRHYCPAPVCAPSRASLFLGVHQGHANVRDNQFDKALENNHTLASVLRKAGYATALFGKWGLQGTGVIPEAHPQYRGFDYFYGYMTHLNGHFHYPKENTQPVWDGFTNGYAALDKCYTSDLWTAKAKQWIIQHQATNSAQPFFAFLSYDSPHAQLQVPSTEYPPGGGTNGGVQWIGTPGAMINTATGVMNIWIHPDYTNATWDSDNISTTPEVAWPAAAKRHATMIRRLDDAMADLLQLFEDLGIDDNTMVVFTSDNGPHNEAGSGGSYTQDPTFFDSFGPMDGIKRDSWEAGIRVPTLVRWPGRIPAGRVNLTPSQFHDWLPTFADLAGVPAPARTDGVSLVPSLTGVGTQRPGTVYVEYFQSGSTPAYAEFDASHRSAVRNQEQVIYLEGYKGVRYNLSSPATDFRIYDTLVDLKETANLAGTSDYFVGLQQRMKDRVLQIRRPLSDAARPYDTTLVPPGLSSNLVPGLEFQVFEGAFPWVPDFATLLPVTNGVCSGLDLSVRTRDDNVGILYSGHLNVPLNGTYTFYLVADSGAVLRLHDATIIDADFNYTPGAERSASINLRAGRHAIRLSYARGTNAAPNLSLLWSGPGIAKQPISAASLLHYDPSATVPVTAFDDTAATPRNASITVNVMANDIAGSGPGPLRIVTVGAAEHGTVTTNFSGQVIYTPPGGFLGDDSFTYTVSDGQSQAAARVRVKVFFTDGSLWFPFNETAGLSSEDAGGAATAFLTGFTNDPLQWVTGKWNRALQFDGTGSLAIVAGYKGILGASNRTFAAWIRTTNTGSILSYGVRATGQKWIMRVQAENGAAGALRVEVEGGYIVASKDLRDAEWHHVAAVLPAGAADVSNVALYVDGQRQAVSAQSARAINTFAGSDLQVGGDMQDRFFTGTIDEIRIYDRALSASEIAALCTATNQSAAAWHRANYGDAAIDWLAIGAHGQPRLLDYAFGASPHDADPGARSLQAEVAEGSLRVSFPRRLPGASELTYTLQASRDLLHWDPLTALLDILPLPDRPGFEKAIYKSATPVNLDPAQYLRLQVTLP